MPMIQTDSQHYTDIADAIRAQNESQDVYYPADMAAAIRSLPNGDVDDVTVDGVSVVNVNKVAVLSTFSGATSQDNGTKGLVPAPSSADRDKALKGDGTWGDAGLVDDVQVNELSVVVNKVAKITSYKPVSQSDYNNLPASKTSDGIAYFITDADSAIAAFISGTTVPDSTFGMSGNIYIQTNSGGTAIENIYFKVNTTWIPMITNGNTVGW